MPNWTMRFSRTVLEGCRNEADGCARPFASTATAVFNVVIFYCPWEMSFNPGTPM
jgi:hypothetical protein